MGLFGFGKRKEDIFPPWCNTGASEEEQGTPLRHILGPRGEVVWNIARVAESAGGVQSNQALRTSHSDHIELTGFRVSGIISYGVDAEGALRMHRHVIFPNFRMLPNDTHASLTHTFPASAYGGILIGGSPLGKEYPTTITIDGFLEIDSATASGTVTINRLLYPSHKEPAFLEQVTLTNTSSKPLAVEILNPEYQALTKRKKSLYGSHTLQVNLHGRPRKTTLQPNQQLTITYISTATNPALPHLNNPVDPTADLQARKDFLQEIESSLVLSTPDATINGMFHMAKRRASESIIATKNGLMHAPGGGGYYAAIWTNDQCEYANPLFPFLGYAIGNQQAINSYSLFMEYMKADFSKPLISSIIAEGDGVWHGAGDRGDAAMFAYGAGRFALSYGCKETAHKLWKGIDWSIRYSLQHLNADGVVMSDSDELENRFKSGRANLCTSCLLYDALISASYLVEELGLGTPSGSGKSPDSQSHRNPEETQSLHTEPHAKPSKWYRDRADQLKKAIESYFGATVEGFDTYRYYKKNKVLRSWICMPLTVGIFTRAKGTMDALFSNRLWSANGVYTEAGCETFWDRSTLFALRGVFAAGSAQEGLRRLQQYSEQRLLGEHVPYAVESYPEGNQRHLSAESALYVRIITEGIFGIRPVGFGKISLTPQLPEAWDSASLKQVHVGEQVVDIELSRKGLDATCNVQSALSAQPTTSADSAPTQVQVTCQDCVICHAEVVPGASVTVNIGVSCSRAKSEA